MTRRCFLENSLGSAAIVAIAGSGLAQASGAETIKLGVMNSLTGASAFGGVPIQNAMKLAVKQANEANRLGGRKLEIVEGDTASDKAQSITLMSKFAQPKGLLAVPALVADNGDRSQTSCRGPQHEAFCSAHRPAG